MCAGISVLEMSNKAETVLVISKTTIVPTSAKFMRYIIREKEFKPLLSLVNEAGSRFSQKGICLRMPHIRNRNNGRFYGTKHRTAP